jgi:hypothetical protein
MKDGNRVSGMDRKDCQYYGIFDSILGTRAATEPAVFIDSSVAVPEPSHDATNDEEVHYNQSWQT